MQILTATYNMFRQKYELSNKYTAVSNLKSYIFQEQNILGRILLGSKLTPTIL